MIGWAGCLLNVCGRSSQRTRKWVCNINISYTILYFKCKILGDSLYDFYIKRVHFSCAGRVLLISIESIAETWDFFMMQVCEADLNYLDGGQWYEKFVCFYYFYLIFFCSSSFGIAENVSSLCGCISQRFTVNKTCFWKFYSRC